METHQCKLCTRSFLNGKALGGHMRSHLFPLPIPSKQHQLGNVYPTESTSSLYSSKENKEFIERKYLIYGLRDNPKKSYKLLVDSQFLESGSGLYVQDRESEAESRNPTRRRSTRTRKMEMEVEYSDVEVKKVKLKKLSSTESVTELEVVNSGSFEDEEAASCLMMLCRDKWKLKPPSQTRKKYQCESRNEVFESFQALGGHRTSQKKVKNRQEQEEHEEEKSLEEKARKKFIGKKNMHVCEICFRVFGSGQALGGHKRSHFLGSLSTAPTSSTTCPKQNGKNLEVKIKDEFGFNIIDLNLPAPMEEMNKTLFRA